MNLILVVFVLLIIILVCVIYIFILLNKKSNTSSIEHKKDDEYKSKNRGKVVDLENLALPTKIKELNHHTLFQSCLSVYDSFKALDYNKKTERKLDILEWHNWQVSLLLALMKEHKNIFIPHPNKVFHQMILEMSKEQLENEFKRILIKYENSTDFRKSREDLREQIIWSAREVSIIFYFMLVGTY